jgi:hypothetical protein
MKETVRQLVEGKVCYLASADVDGVPHLAIGEVESAGEDRLEVGGWFCPRTLANVDRNPSVALSVGIGPNGFQFVGRVEEKAVEAIMDGFFPGDEEIPKAKFRLSIRVDETMPMTEKPHSDIAL